jgi:hypothetical protein
MVSVAMVPSAFATFKTSLGNSQTAFDIRVVDANNGTFNSSLGKFRYIYNPTGNGGTGEMQYDLLFTQGPYVFTGNTDIQNHINAVVAGH